MKTCWRITKTDKKYFDDIYKMFFYKESLMYMKLLFDTWLYNDINEIYITKKDDDWKYILTHNKISTNDTILDVKSLLNLN